MLISISTIQYRYGTPYLYGGFFSLRTHKVTKIQYLAYIVMNLLVQVKSYNYPCLSGFVRFKSYATEIIVYDGLKTKILSLVTAITWIAIKWYVSNRVARVVGWYY